VVNPIYGTPEGVAHKLGSELTAELDSELTALLVQVSRFADTYVGGPGHSFARTVRTEKHDGSYWNGIVLAWTPAPDQLTDLEVTENGAALVDGTDYELDPYPSRMLWRLGGGDRQSARFVPGEANVTVRYASGYEVDGMGTPGGTQPPAVPADIIRCVEDEATRLYKAANTDSTDGGFIGITQRTPDSGAVLSYTTDDLSPICKRSLDTYRLMRFTA